MSNDQGPIIIDTPEGIHMWRMLSFRSALSIEIKTGLKFSKGSLIKAANAQGLSDKKTKRGVYADIDAIIVELGGESKPLA